MLVLYMIANCISFVFLHTLMQVSTSEANIVCIAQTTFEIINNVLLIHNGGLCSFGLILLLIF